MTNILDRVERVLRLPVERERVWAALTEPDQIIRWLGDRAELDLRPGGRALFGWEDELAPARIEVLDPPYQLAFQWRPYGGDPALPVEAAPSTLVEWTLDPIASGTLLNLVEAGFSVLPEAIKLQALSDNQERWTAALHRLAAYLRS
jgi:uncharacterized protein YndB with AHSA1/START domain